MELEIGREYRTRDGRIATITSTHGDSIYPFGGRIEPDYFEFRLWSRDGLWMKGTKNGRDIISPATCSWED